MKINLNRQYLIGPHDNPQEQSSIPHIHELMTPDKLTQTELNMLHDNDIIN